MRTAQLLRHQPLRHWPVLEEDVSPAPSSTSVSLTLGRRSLLLGSGPDSLVAVAAAERSGRAYEIRVRDTEPGMPVYLRRDGLSLEGPRAILEHFVTTTSKVAFRLPVGSNDATRLVQWLDWIDHALAAPISLERCLADDSDLEPRLGTVLLERVGAALEQRAEEIDRGAYLVGDHLTIADLYLWACLELFVGPCPPALLEYRDRMRKEAGLRAALTRFRSFLKASLDCSAIEPPG